MIERVGAVLGVILTVVYLLNGFSVAMNEWKKWKNRGKWMAAIALCLLPSLSEAVCNTSSLPYIPASGSDVDIQACITAIPDTVNTYEIAVPAGSWTWTTELVFGNKLPWIHGAGEGVTNITKNGRQFTILMTSAGVRRWRISHMTLNFATLTSNTFLISSVNVNGVTSGWRVDHVTTVYSGPQVGGPLVMSQGVTFGVFDHVHHTGVEHQLLNIQGFVTSTPAVENSNCVPQCLGYTYLHRNVNLGTDEAIYWEDWDGNFSPANAPNYAADWDGAYGGAYVVRYGSCNYCWFQTHSAQGNRLGILKIEVYKNQMSANSFFRLAQVRSGTGVIWQNQFTLYDNNTIDLDITRGLLGGTACENHGLPLGTCNGLNAYDKNTESTGWSCVCNVGRGSTSSFDGTASTQVNAPFYSWKNGTDSTCITGGACDNVTQIRLNSACGVTLQDYVRPNTNPHGNGDYEFVNNGDTPMPGYAPLIYPHPTVTYWDGVETPTVPLRIHVVQLAEWIWPIVSPLIGIGLYFRKYLMAALFSSIAFMSPVIYAIPTATDKIKVIGKQSAIKTLTAFNHLTKPRV